MESACLTYTSCGYLKQLDNAPKTAVLSAEAAVNPTLRDQRISTIRTGGRMAWQVSSGYNQPSRAETQMGRWKMVIGPKLKARSFPNQRTEAKIEPIA